MFPQVRYLIRNELIELQLLSSQPSPERDHEKWLEPFPSYRHK
jgi:hypothetical protein